MNAKKQKSEAWPRTITAGHASVKLYRNLHPRTASGWIFVLAWNSPTGRRREKFADEGEAMNEARTKAAQLAAGRVEGATMSTGERDELQAARNLAKGVPLLAALGEWAKGRELTGGNILPACESWAARNGNVQKRIKVNDAVAAYLKAKTAAKKKIADMHGSTFDKIKADFGGLFIETISAKQLDAWLAKWDHPVTRNTYRRRLVGLWRWTQRQGYLSREVRTEAELTESAQEAAPEIGIITTATWRSMLEYFHGRHPELLPALVLTGFCGLRRSEIHAQTWEDISLERKNLRVTSAKRGTPAKRMVPLCDAAITWLMLAPVKKGFICPAVEFKGKMQPALAIDGIRRIAKEAMDGKELRFPSVPENCFRHSYISHAVAASGDIARVSLDAGNSPKEINRHYRELVSEAEGKAWFASVPGATGKVITMPKGQVAS